MKKHCRHCGRFIVTADGQGPRRFYCRLKACAYKAETKRDVRRAKEKRWRGREDLHRLYEAIRIVRLKVKATE